MKLHYTVLCAGLVTTFAFLAGCNNGGVHAVGTPSATATSNMLDQVKSLEGEWTVVKINGENSPEPGVITFTTSSAGSSVREVMFPGSAHEMTNMYHMHGNEMMVTHYCAAGNQPRMRTVAAALGHMEFKTESVTNLATPETEYMGELTLDMADKNTLKQTWRSIQSGKETTHVIFELRRK